MNKNKIVEWVFTAILGVLPLILAIPASFCEGGGQFWSGCAGETIAVAGICLLAFPFLIGFLFRFGSGSVIYSFLMSKHSLIVSLQIDVTVLLILSVIVGLAINIGFYRFIVRTYLYKMY
jgi:hypothetical protein